MVLTDLSKRLTEAIGRLNTKAGGSVDEAAVKGVILDIQRALLESDVNIKLVRKLGDEIKATALKAVEDEDLAPSAIAKHVEKSVAAALVHMLTPARKPRKLKKGQPNVVMFVGLQGAGKTTTVAKYANYYKNRRFKVAMVCADTFRAGAFDQLKQNASKLHVPYYGSSSETDPVAIARAGVKAFRRDRFDLIIVDTSGRHKQEADLFREMEAVHAAVRPDEVIFVMDSTIGQAAEAQAEAFGSTVDVGSVIMTKLDGHAKGGGALSAVAATGAPVTFLGSGEHFADLQPFDPTEFVGKLLGRSSIVSLMRAVKETIDEEEQMAMLKRATKGGMTMRDVYDQIAQIQKLGSIQQIMGALGGPMAAMMQNLPEGQDGSERFTRMLVVLDSLSERELDSPVKTLLADDAVLRRVARGSGAELPEVYQIFGMAKQMSTMLGSFGKMGLANGGDKKLASKLKRDPAAMQRALAKSMPAGVMQQMGGAQGMMGMLKRLTSGGGLKDLMGGSGLGALAGGAGGEDAMAKMMEAMGGEGGMPDMAKMASMLGGGGGGGMGNPAAAAAAAKRAARSARGRRR